MSKTKLIEQIYDILRQEHDYYKMDDLIKEATGFEVDPVNPVIEVDYDSYYIIGKYILKFEREDSFDPNYKYKINYIALYDATVCGFFESLEYEDPLYAFEDVDLESFKKVFDIISKSDVAVSSIHEKIRNALLECGYTKAYHDDEHDSGLSSFTVDSGDEFNIRFSKENVVVERYAYGECSYNKEVKIGLDRFNGDEYKEDLLTYIKETNSFDSLMYIMKQYTDEPDKLSVNLANYMDRFVCIVGAGVSDYGYESVFVCKDSTIKLVCLDKNKTYNRKDFEKFSYFNPKSNYVDEDNVIIMYSVSKGFNLSEDFRELTHDSLEELITTLDNSEYDLTNIIKALDELCGIHPRLTDKLTFNYNHRSTELKIEDNGVVRVYINNVEIESLSFKANCSNLEDVICNIVHYNIG